MEIQKIHEIEGFNTNLLRRGQLIKVKHVFRKDDKYEQSEFCYLYFIKNVEIDKLEVVKWNGETEILKFHKFKNDSKYDYYKIEEIYNSKDRDDGTYDNLDYDITWL